MAHALSYTQLTTSCSLRLATTTDVQAIVDRCNRRLHRPSYVDSTCCLITYQVIRGQTRQRKPLPSPPPGTDLNHVVLYSIAVLYTCLKSPLPRLSPHSSLSRTGIVQNSHRTGDSVTVWENPFYTGLRRTGGWLGCWRVMASLFADKL